LATKSDIAVVRSEISVLRNDFAVSQERIENRIHQSEERTERRFIELEFRLITRLGLLTVSTTSIAVAVLTWLIKI